VLFHADDHALVDGLTGFINQTLRQGDAVSVTSTGAVRASLAKRLQELGWSVGESGDFGRYRSSDSTLAASFIVSDGRAVRDRIANYVADLERWRIPTAGSQSRLVLVGDIAAQLLLTGNAQAVMEVEEVWNETTRSLPFLTVCCYAMATFEDDPHAAMLPHLCAQHYAVAHTPEGGLSSLL
jgi:hypothetical protein